MLRASRRMEAQTGSNSQIYSFATNHFFLCSIYAHSTLVLRSCLPNLMNLRTSTSFSDVLCDIATSFLSWSSVIIWALEPNSVHFLTSSLSSFWPWYSYDRTLPTMRNSDLDWRSLGLNSESVELQRLFVGLLHINVCISSRFYTFSLLKFPVFTNPLMCMGFCFCDDDVIL